MHMSEVDIKSISRTPCVLEANGYMQTAAVFESIIDADIVEFRCDTECGLVEFALGKTPKEKRESITMASIVQSFVERVGGAKSCPSPENDAKGATSSSDLFDATSDVAKQTTINLG